MKHWFYIVKGIVSDETHGPYSNEEMLSLIKAGSVDAKTIVVSKPKTNGTFVTANSIDLFRDCIGRTEHDLAVRRLVEIEEKKIAQIDQKTSKFDKMFSRDNLIIVALVIGAILIVFGPAVLAVNWVSHRNSRPKNNADQVMNELQSTPRGRAEVERIGNKYVQLKSFQQQNDISDRIAEAAIKEWALTHGGNFDWDLEDVKSICLRNKRDGIPWRYLPESEK